MNVASRNHALVAGDRVIRSVLPGLVVDYAWLPPWEGHTESRPNRVKVIFSRHACVTLDHAGQGRQVAVAPGGAHVMGEEPTSIRRVEEHSETIDLYPDLALLKREAAARGRSDFAMRSTLERRHVSSFDVDPVFLGLAMRFRRGCMDRASYSRMDISSLASRLVDHLVDLQCDIQTSRHAGHGLKRPLLQKVSEYVEAHLAEPLTLERLAALADLSSYHFGREFKAATGVSPLAIRSRSKIEQAKHMLLSTGEPVQEIVWAVGTRENISHLRRQFRRHVGVLPGELRRIAATARPWPASQPAAPRSP